MKKKNVIAKKRIKSIKKHIRTGAHDVCYLGCNEEVEITSTQK